MTHRKLPGNGARVVQPGGMMPDFRERQRRDAVRLRAIAATVTTTAVKSRLLEEADRREWLARYGQIDDAGIEWADVR